MNLEKAYLKVSSQSKSVNGELQDIEFMFNPTEIQFDYSVNTNEDPGAHSKEGTNKLSFSSVDAPMITIKNIMFDTYEERESVQKYIEPFLSAVRFIKPNGANNSDSGQTVPSYRFIWGGDIHPASFIIDKLSYKFTMFLPNGTPVRAVIDSLQLKQHEKSKSTASKSSKRSERLADNLDNRLDRNNNKRLQSSEDNLN